MLSAVTASVLLCKETICSTKPESTMYATQFSFLVPFLRFRIWLKKLIKPKKTRKVFLM